MTAASLEHHVVAHNDAADSGNPMHDDAAAQALNFAGAVVPGVTVYGYMTHVVVQHFGDAWLERGAMEVRFRRPVYVDDRLSISAVQNADDILTVNATNAAGELCASGRAAMFPPGAGLQSVLASVPPAPGPLPAVRRPATRAACAAVERLGSIEARFDPAAAVDFLAAMQDARAVYREGVTHPAWLLRQANLVVDANLALGPWIHVGSELVHRRLCHNGEALQVRARFVDLYQRKGSEYADLDVAVAGAGGTDDVALRVLHRFIYHYAPETS